MDWSRAKTYLIIALLLANIILITSIYNEYDIKGKKNYYSQEGLKDLAEYLDRYKVKIDTTLKNEKIVANTLLVQYKNITKETYPVLFKEFENGLDILGNKHMILNISEIRGIQNQESAMSYVIKFIEKYFTGENVDIKSIEETDDEIIITLNPLINGKILEDAKTEFVFNKFGGVKIEKIQMDIVEVQKKVSHQISSVDAIIKVAPHLPSGSRIVDVDLIYYYSSNVNQTIFNTKTATAIPTWRIKTQDNIFEYVIATR